MAGVAQVAMLKLLALLFSLGVHTRRCLTVIFRRSATGGGCEWLQSDQEAETSLVADNPAVSWPKLAAAGSSSRSPAISIGASYGETAAPGVAPLTKEEEGRQGVRRW